VWFFKEFFDVTATNHLWSREMVHSGRIYERNGIAKRLRNIQFVGRENDTFVLLMRQVSEQMA
jgi:hypothetical protein